MECDEGGATVGLELDIEGGGVGGEDQTGSLALSATEVVDLRQGSPRGYLFVRCAVYATKLRAHRDFPTLRDSLRLPCCEAHRVAIVGPRKLVTLVSLETSSKPRIWATSSAS